MTLSTQTLDREKQKFEDTSGGPAVRIADPAGTGALRQVEKMNFDVTNQLRVVFVQPALTAGTATIGVVGSHQKLLAAMYADTVATLAAGATFTGTSRDTQVGTTAPFLAFGTFRVRAISDKALSLYIDESTDGTTWHTMYVKAATDVIDYAGTPATLKVASLNYKPTARYVRLTIKNTEASAANTICKMWSRVIG